MFTFVLTDAKGSMNDSIMVGYALQEGLTILGAGYYLADTESNNEDSSPLHANQIQKPSPPPMPLSSEQRPVVVFLQ